MKFLCGSFEAAVCLLLATSACALVLDSETDATVFTMGKCHDIVDTVNASGQFNQESTISICNKRLASKESCRLVGEMLAMAQIRGAVNTSSFCDAMSSAHMCSSAMEDFLSSEAVSDLAFGHCMRQKPAKTQDYCRQFQHVMSTAVKASESMDTLRECYMMELAHQKSLTEKSAPLSTASDAKIPKLAAAATTAVQPTQLVVRAAQSELPTTPQTAEQPVVAAAAVESPEAATAQPVQPVAATATPAAMAAAQPVAAQQVAQAQQLQVVQPVATAAQTAATTAPSKQSAVQPEQVTQEAEQQAVPLKLEQPVTTETQQVVQPAAQPQQVAQTQQLAAVLQTQAVQQTEAAVQANTLQVASQQLVSTDASTAAVSLSRAAAFQQPEQGVQSVPTAATTAQAATQPQPTLISIKPHSTEGAAAASSAPGASPGAAAAATTPAGQKLAAAAKAEEAKVASSSKLVVQDAPKASFLASNATAVPAKANVNSTSGKEYTGFLSRFVGFF